MTQSIFYLTESQKELPSSNDNMSNYYYREVQALRNVQDKMDGNDFKSSFIGSSLSMRFNLDNKTWWLPSKSYLKIRCRITNMDEEPLKSYDNIAPNMNIAANLFQRMQFKMADKTVESIDDNIAECDTLMQRITRSQTNLNKALLNDINYLNPYQEIRKQDIVADGKKYDNLTSLTEEAQTSSRYIVKSKSELGYEGASIQISVAQVLTFNAGPNTDTRFKRGDIIKLRLAIGANAYEAFERVFIVHTTAGNQTMQLINRGAANVLIGSLAANTGEAELTLYRPKASLDNNLTKAEIVAANDSTINITAYTIISNGVFKGPSIAQGDLIITPSVTATTQYGGFFIDEAPYFSNNRLTLNINTADNLLVKAGGAADDTVEILKYSNVFSIVDAKSFGYLPDVHSYTMDVNGVITFSGDNLPTVEDVWQVGDFIAVSGVAANLRKLFFITNVNPINQTITVAGTNQLAAVAANAANLIKYRYRVSPSYKIDDSSQVNEAKSKNIFEICWKPACMGIFNYPRAIPGGCKFEFELSPFVDYFTRAIETPYNVTKKANVDYRFFIEDVKFYILQAESKQVIKSEYYVSVDGIKCHKVDLTSKNLTQNTIDVQPSTYAAAIAFQDSVTGPVSNKSSSKFHVNNKEELKLKRYSIRYAGITVPQPDADLLYSENANYLTNFYLRNNLYTGQFNESDCESLKEWIERGIYFYHPFVKNANNTETRLTVLSDFQGQLTSVPIKLLIFEFYKMITLVKMEDGTVFDVRTAFK